MAQHQQLHELWKKARIVKGKKTPGSSRALEARVAMLEVITKTVAIKTCSQMKSLKLITQIIQPLTERRAEADRVLQILDGQGH